MLIAPAFAGIHLPTYFIGSPVTPEVVLSVLLQLAAITVFAMFFRALLAWIYNVTAHSVLVAATLHAAFNTASGGTFVKHLTPAGLPSMLAAALPLAVVVAVGGVVVVCTRGRLGSPA